MAEPMQERLELGPGRYTIEVANLHDGGGSARVAKVMFALELPDGYDEALTQEASSGESVLLHLEVPEVAPSPGTGLASAPANVLGAGGGDAAVAASRVAGAVLARLRVMVQWRDDYQLAFAVRLVVRLELPDFERARSPHSTRTLVHLPARSLPCSHARTLCCPMAFQSRNTCKDEFVPEHPELAYALL